MGIENGATLELGGKYKVLLIHTGCLWCSSNCGLSSPLLNAHALTNKAPPLYDQAQYLAKKDC